MTNAAPGKGKAALSLRINLDSVIVTQNISVNQLFLSFSNNRLTEVIEILKSIGITDNLAIFKLGCVQGGVS